MVVEISFVWCISVGINTKPILALPVLNMFGGVVEQCSRNALILLNFFQRESQPKET